MSSTVRTAISFSAILLLSLSCLVAVPFIGGTMTPLAAPFSADYGLEHRIFWSIRVPRVLAAFLAGSMLSLGGACFQALFRNSLATPYTLGVSSGAALGVTTAVWLGASFSIAGQSAMSLAAFIGAAGAAALVFAISKWRSNGSTETMLLAGVAVSFFFSSIIMFIQYIGSHTDLFRVMRWMMGGLETTGYKDLLLLAPLSAAAAIVLMLHIPELDLLSVGEDFAASRGVNVAICKITVFLSVSLMVGAVVAFCGPIGFVGMVCPHICRRICGAANKILAPASFLFGGAFLVVCDTFGRTIASPIEIPVGIVTALIGGPFFLWLLCKK